MTRFFSISLVILFAGCCFALEPSQILIIANSDVNESVLLADYYSKSRAVPAENILKIPLGSNLSEQMSRKQYDKVLAPAVRKELTEKHLSNPIKCLLTLYGVPIKIASAGPLKNSEQMLPKLTELLDTKDKEFKAALEKLSQLGMKEMATQDSAPPKSFEDILKNLSDDTKQALKRIEYIEQQDERESQYRRWIGLLKLIYGPAYAAKKAQQYPRISFKLSREEEDQLRKNSLILKMAENQNWNIEKKLDANFYQTLESAVGFVGCLSNLKADIGRCRGDETAASVDSELSMVLYGDYDLYKWQKNDLQNMPLWMPSKTLMVSRLDGSSMKIAAALIDKAIETEKKGLWGKAYIDTRGLIVTGKPLPYSFEYYDLSLLNLAEMFGQKTSMDVVVEKTGSLFAPASCPQTALYCGWYSVKKYIDAFDFVPGAVGFHIASFEAMDLRNSSSSNWCPAMLARGITATLGPVNEPYLHSFPEPDKFFAELLDGKTLVEAFFRTNPFNSWQMILVGDPLYMLNIK
ncbi:MAG: TIGR03790 family protein [Phycisphaerae bacterium]|nr:TIGR03790 family protein [Phycisphaerae bacterium]